jgi:TonB family protein
MNRSLLIFTFIITFLFSSLSFADTFSQVYLDYLASQKSDNYQTTIELAEKLVSLGETKYAAESENTINLKYNLAIAYAANNNFESAFDTMEIVISDYEVRHGEKSEQVFKALLKQLTFAPRYSGANTKQQRRLLKPKAKQAIEITNHLSEKYKEKAPYIYYELSKVIARSPIIYYVKSDAIKYTELAYKKLLNSAGKNDSRTLGTQLNLASIKVSLGKVNQAIILYEDLISNIDQQMDTSHPYELAARSRLVKLYENKGESDKATQHCIQIGNMIPWQQNLDPMPLYRLEPKYPIDLAKRKKEGWAKMSFTIDEMGFVTDIQVLDVVNGGRNSGKESVKVLKKWRYAPKFENGQAVAATDMTVQMDFKLGKPY